MTDQPATAQETVDRALEGRAREPLADPGALAVTAFATTSFMLGPGKVIQYRLSSSATRPQSIWQGRPLGPALCGDLRRRH
jgi:hypothetical protein